MNFLGELKRRNVIRMASLYLVGAWLVIQVVGTVLPIFGAPGWLARSVVVLLAIGFVPALVVSWIFELTPAGLRREDPAPQRRGFGAGGRRLRRSSEERRQQVGKRLGDHVDDQLDDQVDDEDSIEVSAEPSGQRGEQVQVSEAPAKYTSSQLDRRIIVVLLLALTWFVTDKFVLAPAREATRVMAADTSAPAAVAIKPVPPQSIAVLAFVDMSADGDSAYLAAGIAEEIQNALAQVRELKVAGRSSSFHFKDKDENLQAIGQALGVAHVLMGSVRRQGDQVRITAKLIQVADGYHLWSKSFDGNLNDVFDLQERIARATTDELKIVLRGEQAEQLVNSGTPDAEAYALFLQGTVNFNTRDASKLQLAISQLEQAIERDPRFARAFARLASVQAVYAQFVGTDREALFADVERNARRALKLEAALAEPHAAMGFMLYQRRQFKQSLQALDRALSFDPDDVNAGVWSTALLLTTGYRAQGQKMVDRVLRNDPLLPIALYWRGWIDLDAGDLDAASRSFARAADLGLPYASLGTAWLAYAAGDQALAVTQLSAGNASLMRGFAAGAPQVIAAGIFGNADARASAVALIKRYLDSKPALVEGGVPEALLYLEQPALALSTVAAGPTSFDAAFFDVLFGNRGAVARALPQFPAFAREVGLGELWDTAGPPDMCQRNPAGDWMCD